MAREGRPFMMNVQSDAVTVERMDQYKATMSEAGHRDETVARNVADSWVWRNIFVAETDAEAEAVGIPYFKGMRAYLQTNRDRMNTTAELKAQASGAMPYDVAANSLRLFAEKVAPNFRDSGA
jgi:alkanesulfonate monooxygenase SsuD/methylene tetrahydromethanopterin reductase-like flavin-dependent oxidoreductase (luciferase family)